MRPILKRKFAQVKRKHWSNCVTLILTKWRWLCIQTQLEISAKSYAGGEKEWLNVKVTLIQEFADKISIREPLVHFCSVNKLKCQHIRNLFNDVLSCRSMINTINMSGPIIETFGERKLTADMVFHL